MDGLHYLMGAAYRTSCGFGSIEGFEKFLAPLFSDLPFEPDPVIQRARSIIADFADRSGEVGDEKALQLLVAQDLRKIVDNLQAQPVHDPADTLPENRDKYEKILRQLGLEFDRPKLFVVDSFPKPYDKMDWIATSPDRADQENYGIEPGNYFKRSHLMPFRSDFLLAHEMIHQVIGEKNPYLLGRGLEEGIAVAFGELYVGAQVFGPELARLYATYHWFDRRITPGNRLYAEYARMACVVNDMYGLAGLVALVSGGRTLIKQVEESFLRGEFTVDLPSGHKDDRFTSLLRSVTMTTVGNLVVGPLARYVAPYAQVGTTVKQISAASGVSTENVAAALAELQHHAVAVMVDEDRVDYSDIDLMTPSNALRYDV